MLSAKLEAALKENSEIFKYFKSRLITSSKQKIQVDIHK